MGSRFLITDHGSQFRATFQQAIEDLSMIHVRCSVGTWHLDAKVERVNRSLKAWARRTMLLPSKRAIQHRLDAYAEWHNCYRPYAAHRSFTPCEVEAGIKPVYADQVRAEQRDRTHHQRAQKVGSRRSEAGVHADDSASDAQTCCGTRRTYSWTTQQKGYEAEEEPSE